MCIGKCNPEYGYTRCNVIVRLFRLFLQSVRFPGLRPSMTQPHFWLLLYLLDFDWFSALHMPFCVIPTCCFLAAGIFCLCSVAYVSWGHIGFVSYIFVSRDTSRWAFTVHLLWWLDTIQDETWTQLWLTDEITHSASFLAKLSVRSPRKSIIFII